MTRVAVVGGGYAGMAAAVALASRGVHATVLEAAPQLGGRARRIDYQGVVLDCGQHILIGAYRSLLALMERVSPGSTRRELVRLPLELRIAGRLRLAAPRLPAPLHLAVALARAEGLTVGDRLRALAFVTSLRLSGFRLEQDESVTALLIRHGQRGRLAELLWEPLCTAALNTPPAHASARVFLAVLRDSFARVREDSDLLLPRVDLSMLFPDPAARFVEAHGGEVRRGSRVSALRPVGDGFELTLPDGSETFDRVIVATATHAAATLLRPHAELRNSVGLLESMEFQPIVTVYLQYDSDLRMPFPMLGLADSVTQWMFDRGALYGQTGLLSAVVSAAGVQRTLDHDTLAGAIEREVAPHIAVSGGPRWRKVVVDRQATFAASVGLGRPQCRTALPGLALAGDYTASEYPGTLESAVRSGLAAADLAVPA